MFVATVAGRPPALAGVESMIGLFINTLPVRVRIDPEALLLPWLQTLQSQQVEARHCEYSPLVQVQGWSNVPRGLPLFETLLVFENYPGRTALQEWRGSLEIHHVRFMSNTHYPLTVVAVPGPELGLRIAYQGHRFDTAAITRMLGHLRTLLAGMIANPTQRLADLPMLTAAERHQLLVEWNNTATAYPQDTAYPQGLCIHQLFEDQVERTPDTIAVVCEDEQVTYGELNRRANQLAHYLRTMGVRPEVKVRVCLELFVKLLIGLLGILKAGGSCVPLDPTYPPARLTMMQTDTRVPVLVTQQKLSMALPTHGAHVLCLDADWTAIAQQSMENPVSGALGDSLAYVIYTSGSTGRPKGVELSHSAICNCLLWVQTALPLTAADRTLQKAPCSSDASIREFFWPLLAGARLMIARPGGQGDSAYLVKLIAEHRITTIHFVPSRLRCFCRSRGSKPVMA